MSNVIPLRHPKEPNYERMCRHCHMRRPLSWQPNCEEHAYVGEVYDALFETEVECARHEDCDCAPRIETQTARAEVAMDPIGEEWLIGGVMVITPGGRLRTPTRSEAGRAEEALIAAAERALELDRKKHDALPFVTETL